MAMRDHPHCAEQGKALLAKHIQTGASPLALHGKVLISKIEKPFTKGEMKWLVAVFQSWNLSSTQL